MIWDLAKDGFNPCFSGTRARTTGRDPPGGPLQVSILVFLELAPGPYRHELAVYDSASFNPCFSGTRARTYRWPKNANSILCFNPCFSGTRARTRWCGKEAEDDDVSILVFLELAPGRRILQPYLAINISFNLVFLELAPGHSR